MTKAQIFKILFYRILLNICGMLEKLLMSIPGSFIAGIVTWMLIGLYERKREIKISKQKRNAIVLLVSYIAVMIQMAILFRPWGTVNEIDLIPFNTPGGIRYIILYGVANAVVFFPIGILLPVIWEKLNNKKWVLLIGFLGSLFIELAQLILQCGVCQVEDLIMNTVGAGVGYWIYKKVKNKKKK